jgi:hypothetical protein
MKSALPYVGIGLLMFCLFRPAIVSILNRMMESLKDGEDYDNETTVLA